MLIQLYLTRDGRKCETVLCMKLRRLPDVRCRLIFIVSANNRRDEIESRRK